jgi:hypothetical protein
VRLVDISRRSTRRLARHAVGQGGQRCAGIGFANGHLAWVFDWGIGGGGYLHPGIYRYRLVTGELSRAPFPRVVEYQVVGLAPFAADGAYMIHVQLESGDGCGGEDWTPPIVRSCQLIRSEPLDFRPVRTMVWPTVNETLVVSPHRQVALVRWPDAPASASETDHPRAHTTDPVRRAVLPSAETREPQAC